MKQIILLLIVIITGLTVENRVLATGMNYTEQAQLIAPDPFHNDSFGNDIVISDDGSTVLVGASTDFTDGTEYGTGSVYVYIQDNGSWILQAKLTAADGAANSFLGAKIALSDDGNVALIGAERASEGTGTAYIFVRNGDIWNQQAKLIASDASTGDFFGKSVALNNDGTVALIGATGHSDGQGSAYIFTRSGGTWTQETILSSANSSEYEYFGEDVALSGSGSTAFVLGQQFGNVYVFGGINWTEQILLSRQGGNKIAVSEDGNILFIGSYNDDTSGWPVSGAVYVLVNENSVWTEQATLTANDALDMDFFGTDIDISNDGTHVLVGAGEKDNSTGLQTGAAYLFRNNGSMWTQQQILPNDSAAFHYFGQNVSMNGAGTLSIVSSASAGLTSPADTGAVYIFAENSGYWTQEAKLSEQIVDGENDGLFGYSVAVSNDGTSAIVGAPLTYNSGFGGSEAGAAYIFTSENGVWIPQERLSVYEMGGYGRAGNSVAISGDGRTALVGALPATSVYVYGHYWEEQQRIPVGGHALALSDDGNTVFINSPVETHVFARNNGLWTSQQVLTGGSAVALSGDGFTAVIGTSDLNSATVYEWTGTQWILDQVLTPSESSLNFGSSVAVNGDTLLIGDNGNNTTTIFSRSGGVWSEQQQVTGGTSTALNHSGKLALIGTEEAVLAYALKAGTWALETTLTASDGTVGDAFGNAVALSAGGQVVLVGAPMNDTANGVNSGSAYMIEIETSGLMLSKTEATVHEGGTGDSYTIQLDHQPTEDVTIYFDIYPFGQIGLNHTSIGFTPDNWNIPQTVEITAIEDDVVEGTPKTTILHRVSSMDATFDGSLSSSVVVRVTEDEYAGINITPTSIVINEGGTGVGYNVVLTSQPGSDVKVRIAYPVEAFLQDYSTVPLLTFTANNWNVPQTVTLYPQQNLDVTGPQMFRVLHYATSANPNYNLWYPSPSRVVATVVDDDAPGLEVSKVSLNIKEGGANASYTVKLTSGPTENVILTVQQTPSSQVTINPTTLTFGPNNWNSPQTITVSAVDDTNLENDHIITLSHDISSRSPYYDGINGLAPVTVNITDNDLPQLVTSKSNTVVTEGGTDDTYTVKLNTQPSGNVTVTLNAAPSGLIEVSPAELTFTAENWNSPQTVTISAAEDDVDKASQNITISHNASGDDPNYSGTMASVTVAYTDNDTAGVTVSETNLAITEGGANTSYTVKLNSQPSGNVTVTLDAAPGGLIGVNPTPLTFTAENWNSPQTVNVSAAEDDVDNASQNVIISHNVSGDDPNYSGVMASVTVSYTDNDTAGLTLSETTLAVAEGGTGVSYTVRLDSKPSADVIVDVQEPSGQLTLVPESLTFTPENWNTVQSVTLTAVDDPNAEGTLPVVVGHQVTSDDALYNFSGDQLNVNITDNDLQVDELLINGGFEGTIDPWKTQRLSKDRRVCNVSGKAAVARSGECAYLFVGTPGERAMLWQSRNVGGMDLQPGTTLRAQLYYRTRQGAPRLKAQVRFVYDNNGGTPVVVKVERVIQVSKTAYTLRTLVTHKIAADKGKLVSVKVTFTNAATAGLIYVDDVSVTHRYALARDGFVPLPEGS